MTTPTRPPVVTLACVFIGISSALLLGNLVALLSDWGSIAVQDRITEVLSTEPLSGTDVSMTQALSWLRTALLVGVGLSVAGIVFSVFAVRGHRPSRIYLTVLCVLGSLVLITGGLAGFLPAAVALACAFILWSPDSRRWFDAVSGRTPVDLGARPVAPVDADRPAVQGSPEGSGGSASADPYAGGPGAAPTMVSTPAPAATATPGGARPRSVTLAAVPALVLSVLAAATGSLALLLSTVGEDVYRTSMEQSDLVTEMMATAGITVEEMLRLMQLSGTAWLVMGVVGTIAAIAALSGHAAGRLLLRIMSVLTVGVSVLFLPLGLLTGAVAVLTLVQLHRADARAWFSARS